MRKYIVGNWKMNGLAASLHEISAIATAAAAHTKVDVGICPPATLIQAAQDVCGPVKIGAQDCHAVASGAHTGNLSAAMLKEAGASYAIVGHSERRADQGETNEGVAAKAAALNAAGMGAILCVGESLDVRDSGAALETVAQQLKESLASVLDPMLLTIAYEPIWAIGTGRIPELDDIAAMHDALSDTLHARFGDAASDVGILYGGSVNPGNAEAILALSRVDGALVGGASLKAESFVPIIVAAESVSA